MKIRRATADDADALARVHIDSWRAAYRGLVPDAHLDKLDYGKGGERFRQALAGQSEETYLAEENGEALGFVTVGGCRDADLDKEEAGEIWGIYLGPTHWRKGVGRSLCEFAERILQSRGYTVATLWVFRDNDQARRFYEAMGFTVDGGSMTLNLGAPLAAVRYRKPLENAERGAAPAADNVAE